MSFAVELFEDFGGKATVDPPNISRIGNSRIISCNYGGSVTQVLRVYKRLRYCMLNDLSLTWGPNELRWGFGGTAFSKASSLARVVNSL